MSTANGTVWLNGQATELAGGATVAAVVAALGVPVRGVAVALNGEVVPRAAWAQALLRDGDRIEILTATQGG